MQCGACSSQVIQSVPQMLPIALVALTALLAAFGAGKKNKERK